MGSLSSTKAASENEIELSLLFTGTTGRSRQGAGRGGVAGPGCEAFIRAAGGEFVILRLRPDWSIQTNKRKVLVSSREHTRGRSWEAGETGYHEQCWGGHSRNFCLLVTQQAAV